LATVSRPAEVQPGRAVEERRRDDAVLRLAGADDLDVATQSAATRRASTTTVAHAAVARELDRDEPPSVEDHRERDPGALLALRRRRLHTV
jgi:hypothetical protein